MVGRMDLVLCLVAVLATVASAGKWSYVGKSGPLYWHELFPDACGGKNQSPIDLKPEQTLYDPDLKDFAIWYDPPRPSSKMYIKNTGYTVQVDLQGDFYVSNAGLGHVYKAAQFHFHWGHKSHQGSEHTMQGVSSPIELHIVTYNHDVYSNIGEAVTQTGGLAVLGVLFDLTEEDNPSFEYIIRGMKQVRVPGEPAKVELPLFSIRDLLPDDIRHYYRYNGSLTTPGCFETVTWSVFEHKQTISHRQMEEFRKLLQVKKDATRKRRHLTAREKEHNAKQVLDELGIHSKDSAFEREALRQQLKHNSPMHDGPANGDEAVTEVESEYIVNNFRPVQPVNDRIVYRSFKLREVVVVNKYPEGGQGYRGYQAGGFSAASKGGDGNAATALNVPSMTTLMTFTFLAFVATLLR